MNNLPDSVRKIDRCQLFAFIIVGVAFGLLLLGFATAAIVCGLFAVVLELEAVVSAILYREEILAARLDP